MVNLHNNNKLLLFNNNKKFKLFFVKKIYFKFKLQNAVAKLLGQNFPGSSTPTTQTILQQSTPNLQNFQQNLQPSSNYAALLQQQQQFDQLQSVN